MYILARTTILTAGQFIMYHNWLGEKRNKALGTLRKLLMSPNRKLTSRYSQTAYCVKGTILVVLRYSNRKIVRVKISFELLPGLVLPVFFKKKSIEKVSLRYVLLLNCK